MTTQNSDTIGMQDGDSATIAMYETREQWLQAAVAELRPVFLAIGENLPPVQVSCSWPGGGSARKRIGECWARSASNAGVNEIFISPTIDDPLRCLDVLVHELVHAVDDCQSGHKAEFKRIATAVGLEGKMTATVAGAELQAQLQTICERIGQYPHSGLNLASRKKQTTRMLKLECNDCGAVWRMSRSQAEGATACPCCQSESIQKPDAE